MATSSVKTCLLVEKGEENFLLINRKWYRVNVGVDYFTKPFLESSTEVVKDKKLLAELHDACQNDFVWGN